MRFEAKNVPPEVVTQIIDFLQANRDGIYFSAVERFEYRLKEPKFLLYVNLAGADLLEGTIENPKKYLSWVLSQKEE